MRRMAVWLAAAALVVALAGWSGSARGAGAAREGDGRPATSSACKPAPATWACGAVVKIGAETGARVWQVTTDGPVDSVVADRHGGVFIAGAFRRVGGRPRPYVAHVLGDGRVDQDWQPHVWSRRAPNPTLALGRRRLFVAGLLRSPTAPHLHILAVDARTGLVDRAWGRGTWLVDGAGAMTVATGRLYVAGTLVHGEAVFPCLAAMGTTAGRVNHIFRPRIATIGELGCVDTIAVRGTRAYIGGTFISVGGRRANGLGAVDAMTGRAVASWRPRLARCSQCVRAALVYDLAVTRRSVYVALNSLRVDGRPRHGLARLDVRAARLERWAPRLGGLSASPQAVVVVDGRAYASGDFLRVNGTPHRELAALDIRTGSVLPSWHPRTSEVLSLSAAAGGVFVGVVVPR